MKRCVRCKLVKDASEYCRNRLRKDGLAYYCKECREWFKKRSIAKKPLYYAGLTKTWIAANHDKVRVSQIRWDDANREKKAAGHRRRRYKLSEQQYDEMLLDQAGKCKICGIAPDYKPRNKGERRLLHVDHCHKTGKVRGLLCWTCNMGMGGLKDDPVLLASAITYLSQ